MPFQWHIGARQGLDVESAQAGDASSDASFEDASQEDFDELLADLVPLLLGAEEVALSRFRSLFRTLMGGILDKGDASLDSLIPRLQALLDQVVVLLERLTPSEDAASSDAASVPKPEPPQPPQPMQV